MKNKDLMEQMITAIYAKDKLDAIITLIADAKGETVKKSDLLTILNEDDNGLFSED